MDTGSSNFITIINNLPVCHEDPVDGLAIADSPLPLDGPIDDGSGNTGGSGDGVSLEEVNALIAIEAYNRNIAIQNALTQVPSHFKGKFTDIAALRATIPIGADGDYAIVTAIPHDEEFIWDGTNMQWSLTTNTPASTFAQLGGNALDNGSLATEFGARDTSAASEVTARIAGDSNLQNQISALSNALIPHPSYSGPGANVTSSQTTANLEIGQTVNIPVTANFYSGDAGAITSTVIRKNGSQVSSTNTYTDSNVLISATPINYNATFGYAQGAIKTNVLGIPDATGRIPAGSITTGNLTYVGYFYIGYGNANTQPVTPADVRALPQHQLSNGSNVYTLVCGTTNVNQYLVLPPGKSIISAIDLGASQAPVTYALINSNFTMNDAAGNALTGFRLYGRTQGTPYSTDTHTHQITTN